MNYHKQCWYCGKLTMAPVGNHYQCTKCDATYCDLPKPTFSELVLEKIDKGYRPTKYRPRGRRTRAKVASN